MKNLSLITSLVVFIQITCFGQLQRFPKQSPDSSYMSSFLLTNQNNQLFYWVSGNKLLQSRSTDGVNWSDEIVIKDSIAGSTDNYPNEITGIVLNSGRIILIFRDLLFYYIYSDDNGLTWSARTKLPTGTSNLFYRQAHYGSITQSSTGKLLFVYTKSLSGIYFITSSDTGKTWSAEKTFAAGPLQGSVAALSNNNLIIVYQNQGLYSSFSSDDGITWNNSGASIINDTTANTPKVVQDQSGMLWLFYQRIVPAQFAGFSQQDIFYKLSSDKGLTWGA